VNLQHFVALRLPIDLQLHLIAHLAPEQALAKR